MISLEFVPKCPMMVNLLTHIYVTRPQWVNPDSASTRLKRQHLIRVLCNHLPQIDSTTKSFDYFGCAVFFSFRMPGFVLPVTTSIAFLMSPSKCWNSQHGWAPFRYGQLQIQLYFHILYFAAVGHDWSAQMGNRCLCCAYVRLVPRGFLSSRNGASANIIFFTEDQDIIWGHK